MRTGLGHDIKVGFETTAAEVSRNFGHWQDRAMQGTVRVTHHGRPRVVILSSEEYERLVEAALGAGDSPSSPQAGETAETGLSAVLEGMSEGFLSLDQSLRITSANHVAQAYLGRTEQQLLGRQLYETNAADRAAVAMDRFRWVLRSGESVSFESASLLREGRHLGVRALPYRDGVGVIFTNITELRVLQEEKSVWQAEQQALSRHGQICVASLNALGFFVTSNDPFLSFIGFAEEQLADVRLADLTAPTARHDLAQGLNQLLRQQIDIYVADVEFLTRECGRLTLKVAISRKMRDDVCDGFCMVALPAPNGSGLKPIEGA